MFVHQFCLIISNIVTVC